MALASLSDNELTEIFQHLDFRDVARLVLVSRTTSQIVRHNSSYWYLQRKATNRQNQYDYEESHHRNGAYAPSCYKRRLARLSWQARDDLAHAIRNLSGPETVAAYHGLFGPCKNWRHYVPVAVTSRTSRGGQGAFQYNEFLKELRRRHRNVCWSSTDELRVQAHETALARLRQKRWKSKCAAITGCLKTI
jgi:hypothetical protein